MKIGIIASCNVSYDESIIDFIKNCFLINKTYDKFVLSDNINMKFIHENFIKKLNLREVLLTPDYDQYGENANSILNSNIIAKSDKCIILWDGEYQNDIDLCEELQKSYFALNINNNEIINEIY